MAAPIAWRLNWSAFWKSGCLGRLYTKQTKKWNFVMHPPEASPIRGSQALAPPDVPNWLAGGSPLPMFQTGSQTACPSDARNWRQRGIQNILRSPQDRRQEATPHPNPLPAPSSGGEGEDRAGGARRVVHPMDCSVYLTHIYGQAKVRWKRPQGRILSHTVGNAAPEIMLPILGPLAIKPPRFHRHEERSLF